jgi:hypothetical protein
MANRCKKSKFSIGAFHYICRLTKIRYNRAFKEFRNQGI